MLLRSGACEMNACACLAEIDGDDTDNQRDSGDNFEKYERFDGHTANFFQFGVTGDANDQSAKEQWRDDDFDEAQENCAEDLKAHCCGRRVMAKLEAGEESDDNP